MSEAATEIGVHRSTAFRLLGALESRGLVEQTRTRRYRLGFGVLRLAGAVTGRMDVTRHARDVCERLAQDFGETVNVAVRDGRQMLHLGQVQGSSALTVVNWVGSLTPLHATAGGKVLLAHLDPQRLDDLLGTAPFERFTEATITSREQLDADLKRVRADGYAVTAQEYELGLNAIAAPVRNVDGDVLAAVSVSGPAPRLDEARLCELAPALTRGARQISARMGSAG